MSAGWRLYVLISVVVYGNLTKNYQLVTSIFLADTTVAGIHMQAMRTN